MNTILFLQVDMDTRAVLASWRLSDPAMRERLMVFGAMGLVTLLVVLWAIFLRKKRRKHHSHHHEHHHSSRPAEAPEAAKEASASSSPEKRRRWRRSRRRHRPRNPTLAETGGLPPLRPEVPPDPEP